MDDPITKYATINYKALNMTADTGWQDLQAEVGDRLIKVTKHLREAYWSFPNAQGTDEWLLAEGELCFYDVQECPRCERTNTFATNDYICEDCRYG